MKTHELAQKLLEKPDVPIWLYAGEDGDNIHLLDLQVTFSEEGADNPVAIVSPPRDYLNKLLAEQREMGEAKEVIEGLNVETNIPEPQSQPKDAEVQLSTGINNTVVESLFTEFELERCRKLVKNHDAAPPHPSKPSACKQIQSKILTDEKVKEIEERTKMSVHVPFWGYVLEAFCRSALPSEKTGEDGKA